MKNKCKTEIQELKILLAEAKGNLLHISNLCNYRVVKDPNHCDACDSYINDRGQGHATDCLGQKLETIEKQAAHGHDAISVDRHWASEEILRQKIGIASMGQLLMRIHSTLTGLVQDQGNSWAIISQDVVDHLLKEITKTLEEEE